MANPNRRGQAGASVRTGMTGSNVTPWTNTHFNLPYGLFLQQRVGMADITNVTASGGTVTYTAANSYSAGDTVSIYGVNPVAYNLQNATVIAGSGATALSSTQFSVTNAATGTYVSGGIAQKTGAISITIPAGINFVYAIAVGAGGGGSAGANGSSGCAGQISWGWTFASSSCIVGAGVTSGVGGYTRYGNIIAVGGQPSSGGGITSYGGYLNNIACNYWGMANGTNGTATSLNGGVGANGGCGYGTYGSGGSSTAGNGGNGISGGGGGTAGISGVSTASTAGNGGSGFAGGGGGHAGTTTGSRTGGNGGTGISILNPSTTYTGGNGSTGTGTAGAGGGGAGVAGNGRDASGNAGGAGGLGGGGGGAAPTGGTASIGGAGILYLFY